jgi:hypothetical protein
MIRIVFSNAETERQDEERVADDRDAWAGGLVILLSIFYIGARPRWAAAITNLRGETMATAKKAAKKAAKKKAPAKKKK